MPDPTGYNKWTSHLASSGLVWIVVALGVAGILFLLIRLLRKHRRARWLLLVPVLPALPVLGALARTLVHLHPVASAATPVALVGLHCVLKRRGRRGLSAARLFVLAALLLVVGLPVSLLHLYMKEGDRCEDIARDPRIKPLLSFCEPDWKRRIIRHTPQPYRFPISANPRTVFPSGDGRSVYLGFGFADAASPQPLLKLSRADGSIKKVYYLYSPYRGACIPQPARCFLVTPMKRGLLVIDDAADRIEAEIRFEREEPLALALDAGRRKLLVVPTPDPDPRTTSPEIVTQPLGGRLISADTPRTAAAKSRKSERKVWEVDWDTLSLRPHFQDAEAPPFGHLAYGPSDQTLFALPETPSRSLYFAFPPAYPLTEVSIGGVANFLRSFGVGGGTAVDEAHNRLFASYPLEGALYVFDTMEPRYEGKMAVAPGIRELDWDAYRGLVFAGGYLDGKIYAVDPARARVVDAIFVGRKIQEIRFESDTKRLLVTSANGLLEVDATSLGKEK